MVLSRYAPVVLLIFIMLTSSVIAQAADEESLTISPRSILGTWDISPSLDATSTWMLSWGSAEVLRHESFAIHEPNGEYELLVPDHGRYHVTHVESIEDDTLRLHIRSASSGLAGSVTFHYLTSTSIWIAEGSWNDEYPQFDPFRFRKGPDRIYHRRSGPNDNRNSPSMETPPQKKRT